MIDADEGRRPPGPATTALRLAYNRVVMPPTYPLYRLRERRRLAQAAPGRARERGGGGRWLLLPAVLALVLVVLVGLAARRRLASR